MKKSIHEPERRGEVNGVVDHDGRAALPACLPLHPKRRVVLDLLKQHVFAQRHPPPEHFLPPLSNPPAALNFIPLDCIISPLSCRSGRGRMHLEGQPQAWKEDERRRGRGEGRTTSHQAMHHPAVRSTGTLQLHDERCMGSWPWLPKCACVRTVMFFHDSSERPKKRGGLASRYPDNDIYGPKAHAWDLGFSPHLGLDRDRPDMPHPSRSGSFQHS
ncbi:hypothetical protein LY76DRAFT_225659 [Colletotrichum caudatum]|nr:hypothetical protein LY76DRAFT_225659 [Colletotrichum caudatum]